jgi:hypothetical protein
MAFKKILSSIYSFFCEGPDAREKRRQEEEQRSRANQPRWYHEIEEDNSDPLRQRNLVWFSSAHGIDALKKYTESQMYFKQDKLEKTEGHLLSIEHFCNSHRNEELPYNYFYGLASNVVMPSVKCESYERDKFFTILVKTLAELARPYWLDEDGEPHQKSVSLEQSDLVSIFKNPILKFVHSFDCFILNDDDKGTFDDKLLIICSVLRFLQSNFASNKDALQENPWLFDPSSYLNDFGLLKTYKAFLKNAISLAADNAEKNYFKKKLKRTEDIYQEKDEFEEILAYDAKAEEEARKAAEEAWKADYIRLHGKSYHVYVEYYDEIWNTKRETSVHVTAHSDAEAINAAKNMVEHSLCARIDYSDGND